jgi:energy-coupling factor transporter transmembrane protein EcfT
LFLLAGWFLRPVRSSIDGVNLNFKTMKTIIFMILMVISYLCVAGSAIWALVSFVVYLVKDIPFDWTSIKTLVASVIVMIIMLVLTFKSAVR